MDELGRATSSSDGFAIAWSCCKRLLALKGCPSTPLCYISSLLLPMPDTSFFFQTSDFKSLSWKCPAFLDCVAGATDSPQAVPDQPSFALKDGLRHVPHYGLVLAGVAGLPSSVIGIDCPKYHLKDYRKVYKWLEENIESVIGINKDDIDEEDDERSTMEPPSRNETIKAAITLNNFLLSYEKTTPEVLTMLRKIRDEIQGEIDFNKKQKTIESFFKKPS
ncbi:hypothetical protein Tco_0600189 [Tanacetum coccineum]|uniref:Uncharacterized protein n=1 Tax=Tanacetum coccineum TaxID=301880 RepID=A0ABQ4WB44_9ASTR